MKIRRSLSIATVAVASTAVIGSAIALPPVLEKIEQSNLVKTIADQAAKRDTPEAVAPSETELTEALKSDEGKKEFSKKIEKTVIQGRKHVDEREADAQEADERYVAVDEDYAARKAEADRLAEEAVEARQQQEAAQQANAGIAAELYRNSGNDAAQLLVDKDSINKQARSEKYADSAAEGAQASEHKAQALENVADKAAEAKKEAEAAAKKRVEEQEKAEAAAKARAAAQKKWEEETFPALVAQYAKVKGISADAAEEELNTIVVEDIAQHVRAAVEAQADALAKLETENAKKAQAQAKDPSAAPSLQSLPATPVPTSPKPSQSPSPSVTTKAPEKKTPEKKAPATEAPTSSAPTTKAAEAQAPAKTSAKTTKPSPAKKQQSAPTPTKTKAATKPAPSPTPTKTAAKPAPTKTAAKPATTKKVVKATPPPTPTPTKTTQKKTTAAPKTSTVVKPAATTGGWQSKAVAYAVAVTQNPNAYYRLGGNGPTAYDCSGLVQQAFAAGGKYISARTAQAQFNAAPTKIPLKIENLRPGDLVFWGSQGNLWHVAIYIGNGKVAHARNPQAGITVTDVYYSYTNPYPVAVRY